MKAPSCYHPSPFVRSELPWVTSHKLSSTESITPCAILNLLRQDHWTTNDLANRVEPNLYLLVPMLS